MQRPNPNASTCANFAATDSERARMAPAYNDYHKVGSAVAANCRNVSGGRLRSDAMRRLQKL